MRTLHETLTASIKNNMGFICFILLLFASRSSIADWYHVPSGSMQPTIEIGDRIFVNKMAYRLELPFTDISLLELNQPERGDIVVFESDAANNRLIKRIIAVPGDRVSMHNNRLVVNGVEASYQFEADSEQGIEKLEHYSHALKITAENSKASSFNTVTVPAGHFLVLGDNRNNSADSRFYGFVPAHELLGKALNVVASFDPDNYYQPRPERFFSPLI